MDPGLAAVWAAGVAGITSAAGAAWGARHTVRGTAVQQLRQEQVAKDTRAEERRHRHDEWRRQHCLDFLTEIEQALAALDELVGGLREGAAVEEAVVELRRTERAVHSGHFKHVVVCEVVELVTLSDSLLQCLDRACRHTDELRRTPAAAGDPDSSLHHTWLTYRGQLWGAYQMFAKTLPRALPAT